MAKVLDWGLKASEFKLQLCYYIHFLTNTFGKCVNSIKLSSYGLNNTTVSLLQR